MKLAKVHYGWVICCACFVVMAFTAPLVNACASLYLPAVTEEFEISRSAFTVTSTLVAMCGLLLSPIWGKVYSKYNMRWIFSGSLICFALSYMSYSLANSVWQFYVSSVLVGVFYSGCAFMPVSMFITAWFNRSRGLAMSIALGGIGIGGTFLSPLITTMITSYGWRTSYRMIGLLVLAVAAPIALLLIRTRPKDKGLSPYGNENEPNNKTNRDDGVPNISLGEAKTHCFFYVHMLGMLLLGIICSAPLRQISPCISDSYGPQAAALIVSMYSFVGIFGKLILGWINDRFGTIKRRYGGVWPNGRRLSVPDAWPQYADNVPYGYTVRHRQWGRHGICPASYKRNIWHKELQYNARPNTKPDAARNVAWRIIAGGGF